MEPAPGGSPLWFPVYEKAAGMLRLCVVWAALLCWHSPFEVQMGPKEVSMQPSGLDADFPE